MAPSMTRINPSAASWVRTPNAQRSCRFHHSEENSKALAHADAFASCIRVLEVIPAAGDGNIGSDWS
jgi:hypothetical protein